MIRAPQFRIYFNDSAHLRTRIKIDSVKQIQERSSSLEDKFEEQRA